MSLYMCHISIHIHNMFTGLWGFLLVSFCHCYIIVLCLNIFKKKIKIKMFLKKKHNNESVGGHYFTSSIREIFTLSDTAYTCLP